jgi:hypothetical protein
MKAAFLRGDEDPDKDVCLFRRCMGDAKRDDRIYGAYLFEDRYRQHFCSPSPGLLLITGFGV